MQRINEGPGRWDVDGKFHTWQEIEAEYVRIFKKTILAAIRRQYRQNQPKKQKDFWEWCQKNTAEWLVAKPEKLADVIAEFHKKKYDVLLSKKGGKLRKKVISAYGYERKRKKLVELAKMLNVKTCPYCNMQYTLYAAAYKEGALVEEMAKFQFDHFFGKTKYPMLSMSMYNLIPSCASCNQGKLDDELSLEFHPYHAAIKDTFRFQVKNPIPLMTGGDTKDLDIEMIPKVDEDELQKYKEAFHIDALYTRHRDEARETFVRAYVYEYYKELTNFSFLDDADLAERIVKGFYPKEEDIEKRPLTKLHQDLWLQAKGWKELKKYGKQIEKRT